MEWLITWAWQGCLVAAGASALVRFAGRLDAPARCRLWRLALLAVVTLGLAAWMRAGTTPMALALHDTRAPAVESAFQVSSLNPVVEAASWSVSVPAAPPWLRLAAVGLWLAALFASVASLVRGWRWLRAVRREAAPIDPVREARLVAWDRLRRDGRQVDLVVSPRVAVASLVGLGAARIVLSPRALAMLDDDDLDLVVVHELAHARRYDDWWRLGQALVGAVAGLHPAVRWLDRRLAVECEMASDQWVVRATGADRRYAACLLKLSTGGAYGPQPAIAPAAGTSAAALSTRIERLARRVARPVAAPGHWRQAAAWMALAAGVLGLAALAPLVIEARQVPAAEARNHSAVGEGLPAVERLSASPGERPGTLSFAPPNARLGCRASGRDREGSRNAGVVLNGSRAASSPAASPAASREAITRDGRAGPGAAAGIGATASSGVADGAGLALAVGSSLSVGEPGRRRMGSYSGDAALVDGTMAEVPRPSNRGWPVTTDVPSTGPDVLPHASAVPVHGGAWSTAARAGAKIGSDARRAATATAGFFTRMATSVAGTF